MAPESPYSTALELGRPRPTYIKNEQDAKRVTAYITYSDIFYNVPDAYVAVMRNDEGNEISRRLIPSVRTIIEATNRFLAKDLTFTRESISDEPEPNEEAQRVVIDAFDDLLSREEFYAKFLSMKRWMLVRGDGLFHILADDTKPEGSRLRIMELDPSSYFRIEDPMDPHRTIGCYIVTIVEGDEEGQFIAQRQEYLKSPNGRIFTRLRFFTENEWDDRWPLSEEDLVGVDVPTRFADSALIDGFELPEQITALPVYHFRNNRNDSMDYGVSEVQGLETLFAGINQTASDQDVTVVLTGIGVYTTTSGKPRDANGNEVEWVIAPASVIELESKDDSFNRVTGVTTIQPMLSHAEYLEDRIMQTSGTPQIAVGRLQTGAASSGVSLLIQMGPVLSKNEEKEQEIQSKLNQMAFDILNMWLPAYEGIAPEGMMIKSSFGDPLPVDRVAALAEIMTMLTNRVISIEYAQQLIREKLGYDIPTDELARVVSEQERLLDAVGVRAEEEAGGGGPTGEDSE